MTNGATRLLVLGSLPGAVSLARSQYYAHPQNQFWRLIGRVIDRDLVPLDYEGRLQALLDADIRLHAASDLAALAETLPELRAVAFNGGTSARIGRRQLAAVDGLELVDLPSSSPAHASRGFEEKLEAWLKLRAYLRQ